MGTLKELYDATNTKLAALTSLTVRQAWPTWNNTTLEPPVVVCLFNGAAPAGEGSTSRRYSVWQAEFAVTVFAVSELPMLTYIDALSSGLASWGVQTEITLTAGAVTGYTLGAFSRTYPPDAEITDILAHSAQALITFEFTR